MQLLAITFNYCNSMQLVQLSMIAECNFNASTRVRVDLMWCSIYQADSSFQFRIPLEQLGVLNSSGVFRQIYCIYIYKYHVLALWDSE